MAETFIGKPWRQSYTAKQLADAMANQVPIVGDNGHWWRWDINQSKFVDTGISVATSLADASVTYQKLAPEARKSNPNLLDNAYFIGGGSQQGGGQFPINQRGLAEYVTTGTAIIYSIDRWKFYNGDGLASMTLTAEGIQVKASAGATSGLVQVVEASRLIPGREYTLSAFLKVTKSDTIVGHATNENIALSYGNSADGISGTAYLKKANVALNSWIVHSFTFVLPESSSGVYNFRIRSVAGYVEYCVAAMKLELGPHQTLAHESAGRILNDPAPNFVTELEKCQYYQSVITAKAGNVTLGTGILNSDHNIVLAMPVGPLRTAPANSDNPVGVVCSTDIFAEDVRLPITAIGFLGYHPGDKFITMHLACPTGTVGKIYRVGLLQGNKLIIDSNL